jgi:hypothetical protein
MHVGMYGLAAMSSLAMIIYGVALVILLARIVQARSKAAESHLAPFIGRCLVGLIAGIGVGFGSSAIIPPAGTLHTALLRGVVTGGVGASVFFVVCYFCGVAEVHELVSQFQKRILRRRNR